MKPVLACTDIDNIASMLHKDFHLVSPRVYYDHRLKLNADALLIFDTCNVPEDILKLLDCPVIGSGRHTKVAQTATLDKVGIRHPKTLHVSIGWSGYRCDNVYSYLKYFKFPVVLKIGGGARGLGQIKMDSPDALYGTLEYFNEYSNTLNDEASPQDFLRKFDVEGAYVGNQDFNEHEAGVIIESINSGNWFIQELLQDIVEYRVVTLYGNEPMVVSRKPAETGWQCNVSAGGYGEYVPSVQGDLKNAVEAVDAIRDRLNSPWLSADVYMNSTGEWGVFEYQMQMGYKSMPKIELATRVSSSVSKMLANHGR